MFNNLIAFLRRLDPASAYGLRFETVIDDFSWEQILDERLQGPQNGLWQVMACDGHAVIGAYGRRALAIEHLRWSQAGSRTLSGWLGHNGWRLRVWAQDRRLRGRERLLGPA